MLLKHKSNPKEMSVSLSISIASCDFWIVKVSNHRNAVSIVCSCSKSMSGVERYKKSVGKVLHSINCSKRHTSFLLGYKRRNLKTIHGNGAIISPFFQRYA